MPQLPGVHGQHDAGLAGSRQHEARVLVALFARRAEPFLPFLVPLLHLRHLAPVFGGCILAQRRNGGGNDVAEAVLVADVPLALHAEAGDAVPGQLGQQHAADALDQKREGHVFQHAFVPHAHQLFQKSLLILPGHLLHQLVHIAPGIAQPGSQRDLRLRVRRVAQKKHPLLALRHGLSPSP